jgi:hypothetical protein
VVTVARALWKIEIRTGDVGDPRYPEWVELRGYGKRFKYVEREEAEQMLATLRRIQPHGEFRIAPL